MPRTFAREIDVPAEAIDANRHVNNQAYLRWMQDVAVGHSTAQGWPMERYLQTGATWVVRSHFIEYLRPAFEGDRLGVHTWISALDRDRSVRRYLFWRERDHRVIARAETLWVFVGLDSGRPRAIPDELASAFEVVEDEAEVLAAVSPSRARGEGVSFVD